MKIKLKRLIYLVLISFLSLSIVSPLQAETENQDISFKAKVLEVVEEDRKTLAGGREVIQQKLKLKGLEEPFLNEEIIFNGIGDLDVLNTKVYKEGDKLLMVVSYGPEGEEFFYVLDYVRSNSLWYLAIIFLFLLVIIGRFRGFRSFLSLALSFLVITNFIIPQILKGSNPLLITIIGSIFILLVVIYLTEGFKAKSHLAVTSILASLLFAIFISALFVNLAKLTGAASEEVLFLFNFQDTVINLKGLLLAGIIIGALGALDDIVISQIATCEELAKANKDLSYKELFTRTYNVGISHIASMTNTLFLAYAGASLPLLILFVSGQTVLGNWQQVINTELVATEIVRTLAGSIGIVLSVPIATALAAWYYSKKNKEKNII
ncbi:MAG: YibE/F family protein [Candidatus Pacebacteria bacterium]|nr:YibE/F family protein [Candidatus Paceibacterota bacterium]